MNCKRIEQLLPLHVGGDIEDAAACSAIAAHLRACDNCRSLAARLDESRTLLRLHEPPKFDAAFFDEMRGNVMRQIAPAPANVRRALPSPTMFLARLFDRRTLAFAASLALLVAAFATAVHLSRRDSQTDAPTVATSPATTGSGGDAPTATSVARQAPAERSDEASAPFPLERKPGRLEREAATHSSTADSSTAARAAAARAYRNRPARNKAAAGSIPSSATAETANSNPARAPEQRAHEDVASTNLNLEAPPRKTMRIELQTGDPNVRIIWLSTQPGGRHSLDKTTDKR